jgi:ABC-type Fe3+-hydroxamate transport system substrate-binding protein
MNRSYTDQLGNITSISFRPKRIISLVPSQTELLFDLGLDVEIIGLTKFCIHPENKIRTKEKVGGTKKLDLEKIIALNPDLIIGNKEENERSDIEALQQLFPVWMSDILTLDDAQKTIQQIGELVDRTPEAAYLNHLITAGFNDLQMLAAGKNIDRRVLYLIWKNPYMASGQQTYINDIMTRIGLRNVIVGDRYPVLALEEINKLDANLILLSSEPYPFKEKHLEEFKKICPAAEVLIVDGEMFSWYGSRLVKAVEYMFHLQQRL